MKNLFAVLLAVMVSQANAQEKMPKPLPFGKLISMPDDAVRFAIADLQTPVERGGVPELYRTSTRWIWVRDGDHETIRFLAQAVNLALRHSSLPQRPPVVGGGYLMRIEGRNLCPNSKDLERFLNVWERGLGFNFDYPEPYFHQFYDKAEDDAFIVISEIAQLKSGKKIVARIPRGRTIQFLGQTSGDWMFVEFEGESGWILISAIQKVESIQVVKFAEHIDPAIETLRELTGSTVPIVEARFFIEVALSSVDGGQYYNFRGIEKSSVWKGEVVVSALDKFIARAGADFDLLESKANRLAQISDQTGKWRRVNVLHGDLRRPNDGPPYVWITFDQRDKRRRGTEHPLRSLISLKYDAVEVMILTRHGWECGLFNGNNVEKGQEITIHERADAAPDDVTKDHTVPAPYTARLQSCISCVRCHGPDRGFKPLRNELLDYLKNPRAANIVLDVASGRDLHETLDLIAGLYSWNPDIGENKIAPPDNPLEVSRRSLGREVFLATGGLDTEVAFKGISDLYGERKFTRVTPTMVCAEIGERVAPEQAAARLIELLGEKIGFESPIVNRLQLGRDVLRSDLDAELPAIFFRAKVKRAEKVPQKKGNDDGQENVDGNVDAIDARNN